MDWLRLGDWPRSDKNGRPREELCQLLHYMEHTRPEYAVNDSLKKIQRMIDTVKMDEEVTLNFMRLMKEEERLREEGREEGRREEKVNTERERLRAEAAEERVRRLLEENRELKARYQLS